MVQPIELATRSWGEGEARALLVHGLSSSAASWWRVAPDIADLGFHVVAPELRGHGATGQLERVAEGVDGYVADVLALGGGWAVAVGHSLGGRIVLECQLAEPTFAGSVVLEDPALHIPYDPDLLADLASEYDIELTEEALTKRHPRWTEQDVAGKVEALKQSSPAVVAATLEALLDGDHWPKLRDVAVPVLVVGSHPKEGGLVTGERGDQVAQQANVEYIGVPGAGHSIHRDSYEVFWTALAGFLERSRAAAG